MLPRLEGINGVDLDVNSTRVLLTKTDMYRLDLKLPYKVDDAKGKAKFDKAKRMLELTLPVIPPPAPPQKTFVEPVKMVEEIDEAEDKVGPCLSHGMVLESDPPPQELSAVTVMHAPFAVCVAEALQRRPGCERFRKLCCVGHRLRKGRRTSSHWRGSHPLRRRRKLAPTPRRQLKATLRPPPPRQ